MKNFAFLWCMMVVIISCTPKVNEKVQETEVEVPIPEVVKPKIEEGLSTCTKFQDIPNGEDVKQSYVIYRDFFKLKKYEEGYKFWKEVYDKTPGADGRRWTVYSDGIAYYEHLINKETDPALKEPHIKAAFKLYDELAVCYPEQKTYVEARKAFDYYYKYPDRITDAEKYDMFKEVIDSQGMESPVFVINPFTALMYNRYLEEAISMEEAQKYAALIPEIIKHNLAHGKDLKSWDIVRGFAPALLEQLEAVEGFYDCEYFIDHYYDQFFEAAGDCETALGIYSKLRFGGCDKEDPRIAQLYDSLKAQGCIQITAPGPSSVGRDCLAEGDYRCAIEQFLLAANETDDIDRKASYLMIVAKIYYAHLKNYPRSRQYAREAAQVKSRWGAPYILIGKLYASSGPICGPGRGFDSQIVTWPAIDKWQYAKSIDPGVTSEANSLISNYSRFMPSREDIFQRNLKNDDSFTVGCWIQETTKIRPAP
jgi:tetratricopeptide (TPR) repeat protein